jgi:hypothetical protein
MKFGRVKRGLLFFVLLTLMQCAAAFAQSESQMESASDLISTASVAAKTI